MTNIWQTLSCIDVNKHTEKKQGMTYLSWAWAWGIVKDSYPNASFEKHQFDGPNGKRPYICLLYTSPSPRDGLLSRMPSSA